MRKYIEVKLDIEGLHSWPNCNIEEVEYLKYMHRHTFSFQCRAEVTHNDRDIINTGFRYLPDYNITFSNAAGVTDRKFDLGITYNGNIFEI